MTDGAAANVMSDTERRIKHLESEVEMLTKAGIIEVAIRNPSVADYMQHWEGRALKAEAALATAHNDALVGDREFCNGAKWALKVMSQHVFAPSGEFENDGWIIGESKVQSAIKERRAAIALKQEVRG